jgi:hypothetical protein
VEPSRVPLELVTVTGRGDHDPPPVTPTPSHSSMTALSACDQHGRVERGDTPSSPIMRLERAGSQVVVDVVAQPRALAVGCGSRRCSRRRFSTRPGIGRRTRTFVAASP